MKKDELVGIWSVSSILRIHICLYLLIGTTFCSKSTKPDDIAPPVNVSLYDQEPSWSPNGDLIAFYRGRSEPGISGLYLMNSDGSNLRYLASLGRAPQWSPQGDRILYRLLTDNQIYVYFLAADSSSAITSDNHKKLDAVWFPNGESIAYSIHIGPDSTAGIWKFDLNTSSARRIIPLWSRYPSISPSGTHITFIENTSTADYLSIAELYPDSIGSVTRLVSDTQINTPDMQYPSFNADGTIILFQADNILSTDYRIFMYDINGANNGTITKLVSGGVTPAWSFDNNHIIYARLSLHSQNIVGNGYLWIMNIHTNNMWQITFP